MRPSLPTISSCLARSPAPFLCPLESHPRASANSRVTFLAVECAFARFRSRMSAAGLPRQVLTMVYNC